MTAPDTSQERPPILAVFPDAAEVFAHIDPHLGAAQVLPRVPSLLVSDGAPPPVLVLVWEAGPAMDALRARLRSAPPGLVVVGLCDDAGESDFWSSAALLPALAATAPLPADATSLTRALRSALTLREASIRAEAARVRADTELAKVLYSVSHDLRAPTQGLVGLAGLLAETEGDRLSPDGREVCAEIEKSGQRLSGMVDTLAICSRLERHVPDLQEVELQPLVEGIFAMAISRHQTRFPRLSLDPAPTRLVSDAELLTTILQALVDNAVRYSEAKPPRVHVGVEMDEAQLEISVVDNGPGLTPEQAEAAFDLFTRLHPRQSGGVGAGLTMARQAAKRLGGAIRCERAPGAGSSFIVTLPLRTL
ncbi:MAG: HAMP domain-containing sensor histidine kinase [Myxococcota bacterium]